MTSGRLFAGVEKQIRDQMCSEKSDQNGAGIEEPRERILRLATDCRTPEHRIAVRRIRDRASVLFRHGLRENWEFKLRIEKNQ